MNLILFDDQFHSQFYPLTMTRPLAELRFGIRTIREKWEDELNCTASWSTTDHLEGKFPLKLGEINILVNGRYCPNMEIIGLLAAEQTGEAIMDGNHVVGTVLDKNDATQFLADGKLPGDVQRIEPDEELLSLENIWDLFLKNDQAIEEDYDALTVGRTSQPISETNLVIGKDVFIEKGAEVEGAILNTKTGPIYIGKGAQVMEGAMIRGPFALGEDATVKMGAKIYGATSVGPHCKVGGEVSNTIFQAYSNKGHDGFLGNALIGEWCNLGADTNSSNLKNNYGSVKVYNYDAKGLVDSGQQFCGLIMGDHSKAGINTMFNTGTVVGVSANVFGGGFPEKHVPSFTWGGIGESTRFKLDKAYEVAERMMSRRGVDLTEHDKAILKWAADHDK